MTTQMLLHEPHQEVLCTTAEASLVVTEKSPPLNRSTIDPVTAPPVLLIRLPLARLIEGSRPALVLGEGVRMITAHPMARTVFWGGLGYWLCSAVLAAHHADATVRFLALLVQLTLWLLLYFAHSAHGKEQSA